MTLDESAVSRIDDPKRMNELRGMAYDSGDNRPAWVGEHRPEAGDKALDAMARWAATHYDFYLGFVRDYMERRGRVLDIGCGAGQNTAMLGRYAERAVGLDADKVAVAFAQKYNASPNVAFYVCKWPADGDAAYDYIFCVETMEHVAYDAQEAFIDAALARLLPGGLMFITTPREETAAAPHIGVWSEKWAAQMRARLGERVIRAGYLDNQNPGAGISDKPSSHRAWVLR